MLAMPLLAACTGQTQKVPDGSQATVTASGDRQAHFDRRPGEMSACFSFEAMGRYRELEFDMSVSPPLTTAAKKYRSDTSNLWAAEFHDSGGGTDVMLRKGTASASDLGEVWRLIERCAA